ncbi:Hypothetical protein MAGb_5440 [Mycoplasmopsis agalactiae 14628]|uniref:DJ-1/PfpI domain-containing protein n=1 Tax=Mycoplasmopsis agalactiae 14628 TaxID=1110504 RepID=I5D5G8_MYCAA|nr:DJ-1/PfpI family protein [Mycoplasmopsis agalactiae]EIN14927.1 Hypothetical protein MAGb_5440 [Mycoplasmopsis agalactiae 14628]
MKLLVIVHNRFNDMELVSVLSVLKRSKQIEEITYFNPSYKSATGQHNIVTLDLVNKIDESYYDAIFIPGGAGAKELREDKESLEIIKNFRKLNKYVFAICDAPNALYENGIITESEVYSSFPIENIDITCSKNRSDNLVSQSNKLFTGKAAAAGTELGLLIIKSLYGSQLYTEVKDGLEGN